MGEKITYHCENCHNDKADDMRFNGIELDHLEILYGLVNSSELSLEQIGSVVFSLFYVDKEE